MYRYYSTQRPVGPGTFPGRPENIVNFSGREDVSGIGLSWGYLEYREPLDDDAIEHYELKPASLKKFVVKVTTVHTLEVEAENEDKATEKACGMAWEYDADEINGEVICEDDDERSVAVKLGVGDKFDEIVGHDEKFRYQLLSRMKSDCEYFLGNGNRHEKYLWGQEVGEHIGYMKALWISFQANKKPEWLSFEEIEAYEKRMSEEAGYDD